MDRAFRLILVLGFALLLRTPIGVRAEPTQDGLPPLPSGSSEAGTSSVILTMPETGDVSSVDDDGEDNEPLPPLAEELYNHGGAYLYSAEGDRLNWPEETHDPLLRLPEDFEKPRPLTAFQEWLGADPIHPNPGLQWFGEEGFQWEPRFVGYGSYEMFGIAFEGPSGRRDGIGHQLLIDLDLRVTGTERAHVQFRPLGRKNSGGSLLRLSNPEGYDDNSTLIPDRFWIEGEFYSIFSAWLNDDTKARDYHIVAGKFPFVLHNSFLMNDDILGVVVNKNTIISTPLSNLNVQTFFGIDDVDNDIAPSPSVYGVHLSGDYRRAFLEATYAALDEGANDDLDAYYAALSATQFFGVVSLTGRTFFKWGDDAGTGDGQLYVVETNWKRRFSEEIECRTGIEHVVAYANFFKATAGWNSISGGNFDRLRSAFEVDPLVGVSSGTRTDDTLGVTLGAQFFRHHEDESFVPEISYEEPSSTAVWGVGLRYLRKIGPRTYLEALGIRTWSSDDRFEREGVFVSTYCVF